MRSPRKIKVLFSFVVSLLCYSLGTMNCDRVVAVGVVNVTAYFSSYSLHGAAATVEKICESRKRRDVGIATVTTTTRTTTTTIYK